MTMLLTHAIESAGPVVPSPLADAEALWASVRADRGMAPNGRVPLLKTSGNAKLDRQNGSGVPTLTVTHTLPSGRVHGTCTNDALCADTCVVEHSHNAGYNSVRDGRAAMLALLAASPEAYAALLVRDASRIGAYCERRGLTMVVRPNTGSDIAFERWLPEAFWAIVARYGYAYDYTKRIDRVGWLRPEYRTTYSVTSATREATVRRILGRGDTATVVLPRPFNPRDKSLPASWAGMPMVNGDVSDDRYADPSGVLVGLSAKGQLLARYRRAGEWGPLVTALPESVASVGVA